MIAYRTMTSQEFEMIKVAVKQPAKGLSFAYNNGIARISPTKQLAYNMTTETAEIVLGILKSQGCFTSRIEQEFSSAKGYGCEYTSSQIFSDIYMLA